MSSIVVSRRSAFALALTCVAYGARAAEQPGDTKAPFGLTWGMSADDVRKLGATLTDAGGRDYGKGFTVTGLERVLSDAQTVLLFFGYRDRLFRIVAVGRFQGPDPYGASTLTRYKELAAILEERYGKGRETDLRDREMWKAPNEYVMSLKQGRALRFTSFLTVDVEVELSMRAKSQDESNYVIIFSSRPGQTEFELDKRRQEKDSL